MAENHPAKRQKTDSSAESVFVYTGTEKRPKDVPRDVVVRVQLDASVVEVSDYAFFNCKKLREVVLNDGLRKIGWSAFIYCTSLQHITLPVTITEIGDCAFFYCENLREVVLNEGLMKIGGSAFFSCSSLEGITLPSTITEVGKCAFLDCRKLREVVLNDGLMKIGYNAFSDCSSLERIALPSTITEVGKGAFFNCRKLREVVLNDGLMKIGEDAFSGCTSLEQISVPRSVREISRDAFRGCESLQEVILHVGMVLFSAFEHCRSVQVFRFPLLSRRLVAIAAHWEELSNIVNESRGESRGVVQWTENGEMFASLEASNWGNIRDNFSEIERRVSLYEMKEAITIYELALWKGYLNQAKSEVTNRYDFRAEVPKEVKYSILEYLKY